MDSYINKAVDKKKHLKETNKQKKTLKNLLSWIMNILLT